MPNWAGSDRRDRLPADWDKIRKRILKRDGYECQWLMSDGTRCGEEATDVDHKRRGDDHSDRNLRALCGWHHEKKTGAEGAAAYNARRREIKKKFRRTESHPGLL